MIAVLLRKSSTDLGTQSSQEIAAAWQCTQLVYSYLRGLLSVTFSLSFNAASSLHSLIWSFPRSSTVLALLLFLFSLLTCLSFQCMTIYPKSWDKFYIFFCSAFSVKVHRLSKEQKYRFTVRRDLSAILTVWFKYINSFLAIRRSKLKKSINETLQK